MALDASSRQDTGAARPHIESAPRRAAIAAVLPGLALAGVLAAAALALGSRIPVVGAPVVAVLAGIAVRLILGRLGIGRLGMGRLGIDRRDPTRPGALDAGVRFARTTVLQLAVVVLGLQLVLSEVVSVGVRSLPVLLATLGLCLLAAALVGRWLGIEGGLRTLIGVGTGICGASAIAATSPVLRARSDQVAYAVSTIFLFNVLAVLAFPPLGHALGMSPQQFGLFAGTAVNDTSSVVAAATSFGHGATDHAVVVKLVRSLMIIPIVLFLAGRHRRTDAVPTSGPSRILVAVRLVPWFLVAFLAAAAIRSAGLVPAAWQGGVVPTASALVAVALAGIGLSTDVTALRRTGARPLVLGLVLWVVVSATSLAVQSVV